MDEQKWIAVLDCNNFFVSCERLFRPDLKKRPVLVLSSNDGCVVARSQEVKDMSIPMGIPVFQIKDIIKDKGITTFSSNFALYRDISQRVMSALKLQFTVVDQYSIDESFFELVGNKEGVERQASRVKDIIERTVGVPVSIGVGATKTQAKFASVLAKRSGGVCVLDETQWGAATATAHISTIWGVGRALSARFAKFQLTTVASVMEAPATRIETLFGVVGMRLWHELRGEVVYPVSSQRDDSKSIMSSRSFAKTTTELSVLKDALFYHAEQVSHEARAQGLLAGQIRLHLYTSRYGEHAGEGGSLECVISTPTNQTGVIIKRLLQLLLEMYMPRTAYKKLGVELSKLSKTSQVQQLFWFDDSPEVVVTGLSEVVDDINTRLGTESLLYGRLRGPGVWQSKTEFRSPSYTTNWSDLPIVKG